MAELLKDVSPIRFAISWSGACHNGIGVFKGWFNEYYKEALESGYAKIPLFWREDLLLSKKWFDDICDTTPMVGIQRYAGPILAIAGDEDELVPYHHAKEIVENSKNNKSKVVIVPNSTATIVVSHENEPRIPELGFSAPDGSERHQGTVSGSEKPELAPAVAERECPACLGTGIICPGDPNFGLVRGNGNGYAGCGGTGYSPCPDIWCNNGIKTCQNCRGSGIDQRGEPDQVCGGRGIVDCEFCNNTGIAPCICASSHVICDQCNGTGKVSEDSA